MLYHPDPTAYIARSGEFGALGKAMVSLSNLEFAHDEFVFAMYNKHRDLSIRLSKKFPRQFKEKTDFLVNSVSNISDLRKIPFHQTGELNLLWLQYQLDEIYEIRSIIAHGSIFISESTPDRIIWKFERFVQSQKHTWTSEAVKISNGYLASVHHTASAIKHYLAHLKMCLEERSCWESEYQKDKEIRRNRELMSELVEAGIIVDDKGWIKAFPPLGPVE